MVFLQLSTLNMLILNFRWLLL